MFLLVLNDVYASLLLFLLYPSFKQVSVKSDIFYIPDKTNNSFSERIW